MSERLHALVNHILNGGDEEAVGVLSTGEHCFVALAANRYDLLPENYRDPIEAWHRLDQEEQVSVCVWRGWPRRYVEATA
jgi:hypothetical protein